MSDAAPGPVSTPEAARAALLALARALARDAYAKHAAAAQQPKT